MFTGIVAGMGTIKSLVKRPDGFRLAVQINIATKLTIGQSLALDGVCLTVIACDSRQASFDIIPETLAKTTLGRLKKGDLVNYEQSLTFGDQLGGHLVSGHVDCPAAVADVLKSEGAYKIWFDTPPHLDHLIVNQGSIAINGVSLTVAGRTHRRFAVALIPETLTITNLGRLKQGDIVNIEVDQLAKLIARQIDAYFERHKPRV